MAQFKFQLDGVLRQRKLAEEERQRAVAVVRAEMTALEAELRAMDASVQQSLAGARENLVGRVDLSYLAAHRRFTASMQRKALAIAQQMAAVQVRVDAAQRLLSEAAMQRKVIEKLRERREAEWKADQARREMADLDEVATRIGYRNAVAAAEAWQLKSESATVAGQPTPVPADADPAARERSGPEGPGVDRVAKSEVAETEMPGETVVRPDALSTRAAQFAGPAEPGSPMVGETR